MHKSNAMHEILSALCLPDSVIPHGLSTLYRCSMTTVTQDKPYHQKQLIRGCYNDKGSCNLFRPYSTIVVGISSSSFVQISTRQLSVNSLSREFQALSIFTRALVLTGLELTTSHKQRERHIKWDNFSNIRLQDSIFPFCIRCATSVPLGKGTKFALHHRKMSTTKRRAIQILHISTFQFTFKCGYNNFISKYTDINSLHVTQIDLLHNDTFCST